MKRTNRMGHTKKSDVTSRKKKSRRMWGSRDILRKERVEQRMNRTVSERDTLKRANSENTAVSKPSIRNSSLSVLDWGETPQIQFNSPLCNHLIAYNRQIHTSTHTLHRTACTSLHSSRHTQHTHRSLHDINHKLTAHNTHKPSCHS